MNAEEIVKRAIAHGADEAGIADRFCGNAELYARCFSEFLEEPAFSALEKAMADKDYPAAFSAAHALKGISGNLGLTAFYDAVCALVESLRNGGGATADAAYAQVCRQRRNLFAVQTGKPAEQPERPVAADGDAPDEGERKDKRNMRVSILAILAALLLVVYLFCRISVNYRNNVVSESGQHLIEMSNQIKLYIEERIANDWRIAESVGDSLTGSNYRDDDQAILGMLQAKQAVWGVSGLILYTENGYCVNADGSTETNDVASDTIVKARAHGRYMTIIDSRIIYTVPVEAEFLYKGSKIAAVSTVRDMKSFLDDMEFSSFDERAWMYLTEENGVVISMLTNKLAVPAFNFMATVEGMRIDPLNGTDADLLRAPTATAFLLTGDAQENYAVSVPIETGDAPLRLFYLAPEEAVNRTMNGFSRRLTVFSLAMVTLFGIFALVTFLSLYRARKRRFDKAIMARDRMFDLLVKNTSTAFALFDTDRPEPAYTSSNTADVVGDAFWTLTRDENGYRMKNDKGTEPDALLAANEMLAGWDGKTPFKSGYIRNDAAVVPYYFEFRLYPIDEKDGDFVGVVQDVTQAYERDEATRIAMEMSTRANEAKSRFLSNMPHDIRTPMNAIMNMTNFALESIDQPKKLGTYLHTIRESSEHLLHIINDVLDMSRIESGQTVVASEPFNLRAELLRQADMIRPLCAAKGQTLITDFEQMPAAAVRGDALKLSQIIMNLLSNAVKFTPEKGAVRFTAVQVPSLRDDIVDVRFTVEDNGIGIAEAEMPTIFDPFRRADDRRVDKIEGTGLGLSICKSYVDAMGGSIRCESEAGEGSTFIVELFFEKAEEADGAEFAADGLSGMPFLGMRCLVAEDNPINRVIAKELLERLGFLVDFACDGGEAARKFAQSKPGAYDVIYMDIQMPVLDGCEATVMIRNSSHPRAQTIPIVAMTANAFAEDIEKARVAGMDAYVGKPIVSFHLAEQTEKAIQMRRGRGD